ncbi:MFS transporter [Candidatus Aciduliprofundum boonei]|uniref:Major facilitator superfamily MFS_1 n=1 Tax=Aciduliprofundum boonei (strain DSM 19572 / T469) TaxID=439481 RepID=B5ID34_ACIB4|nr:MFS transporter [Candidatus Aciduliprofundum boonei]ADD09199.1 major facilitator superfamily MFS_1 [Aciduliprofundum boonei T469]EDY35907.1 transporter, major facilitator family [Aciduliprofundum boonei T469]HII55837.1 MFS transporter [Candidatus Aciduliprofundum boonei]
MEKWKIYSSILIIPIFGGMASQLLRVVLAFTLRGLGLTVLEITILSSTFMLARGLSAPLIGNFADKGWSRIFIMILGFLGLAIDSFLYLVIPYPWMIGLRALDGVYGAMAWTTMQAVVHLASPVKFRGRLMSSYFMMGGFGGAVGYILYNYFLGNVYHALITVATFYILAILLLVPLRDIKEKKGVIEKATKENEVKFGFSLYSLNFFYGMFFSLGAEVLWFYLSETMALGKYNTTFSLFIFSVIAIFGTFLMGHISDKKGYNYALKLLGTLSLISGLAIMSNSLAIVLSGTLIFYITGRGFMPIARSFAASKTQSLGKSLGFVNMSSNMGSVVAPLIGGALYDALHSYHLLFFNMGAMIFFVMGVLIFVNTYIMTMKKNN